MPKNHANIKGDKYVAQALSPKMFANKNNGADEKIPKIPSFQR